MKRPEKKHVKDPIEKPLWLEMFLNYLWVPFW